MKTIVINNPAARGGGALTILKNCIEAIYKSKCKNKFYIIVSLEELKKYEKENITIIVIKRQNLYERIKWDNFELKKYLKREKIIPTLFFSLQNTGVNLSLEIPQILYFHQAIPLSKVKWNILKKTEKKYWFYKNIYPFFIKQYLNRVDRVIVQAEWIKKEFSYKFKYSLEKIYTIKPDLNISNISSIKRIPKIKFIIFYPAAPLLYKNHRMILDALISLNKKIANLEKEIECIFTFSKGEDLKLDQIIERNNLQKIVKLVGKCSYSQVLSYYKSSDLLIFASSIETLGLPLMEAQYFDLNILSIELPYAKEALKNYSKKDFFYSNLETKLLEILERGEKNI